MYKNLIEMPRENEGRGVVGAFNLYCFEMLPAMIVAAQELGTPITIQASLGTAEYIGSEALTAAVKALAKEADINMCPHMDHCKSTEALKKAIDLGHSSVMYDGSDLPPEENIKNIQEAVAYAHECNVSVEGEIGSIGGAKGDIVVERSDTAYTKPADAIHFVKGTNVDALAVTIGATHGQYKPKANINYELPETLQDKLPDVRLVLHGGTGVSDKDVKRCARGMRKVDIGMELDRSYIGEVNASFPDATPLISLRKLSTPANDHIKRIITEKSTLFKIQPNVYGTVGICITESDNTW